MERRDDYKFLPIRDAITCINQKVSFIGAVVEFTFPRRSKGTDWCCSLKVVDQSHPKHGIVVNVFTATADDLPNVSALGDIVQFRRVVIKPHNGEVNALFNKKFSTFALYEGQDGPGFNPYQSSARFRMGELDSNFIASLRKWLVDFHLDEGLANNLSFLREITEGARVNIVCKVLHIYEYTNSEWMALIWDGTDCPPNIIKAKLEEEKDNPLPLSLEPFPLPKEVLCTFPTVGTILRVMNDRGSEMQAIRLLNSGKWVKLFNLSCEVRGGLWYGLLTPFTKVQYTTESDRFVLACQKFHQDRLSNDLERMPYSSFPWCSRITEVDHDNVPFVTLMDIITYPKVTAKFRCIARVVASLPWRVEDFRSPLGIYRIRVTLEDPTARIHAFVYAEDGEKLFEGYPSLDILRRKRDKLLGITVTDNGKKIESPRNPPWIQLCLKSYYLDKSDAWRSRQYRIFGTKVLV
ncbi:unnamed protein product [Linum tenue]|uniref:Telomeric single stranded DNA binding POT1/Cdc13 domain-containing protein n=1 Tax=Linum tenue TaxID=586396 RepID=A0AAV0IUP4_9ROSI|nr:unnamed protein product [Linum tenue]